MKTCPRCSTEKPLLEFHKQGTGRHSWCKGCYNANARVTRKRNYSPEQKRRWLVKGRYGLSIAAIEAMVRTQGGRCGLCWAEFTGRYHIDHDHLTGKVRGLLCHRCNILIGGLDDPLFRAKAVMWLERGR